MTIEESQEFSKMQKDEWYIACWPSKWNGNLEK